MSSIHTHLIRLCLSFLLYGLPVILHAQETVLDQYILLPDTICRLDTALNIIETSAGFYFSYNPDIIPVGDTVRLHSPGDTLNNVLRRLISNPEIQFKLVGNLIVIAYIRETIPGIPDFEAKDTLPEFRTIRGKIIENNTDDPIPFATISLAGTRIGTISSADGNFVFKYPGTFYRDSMVISCMGFEMEKIGLDFPDNAFTLIRLDPDYIPIQEVIIRKTDPLSLLRSSIARIPDNYFTGPVNLTTFYRESVKKGDKYVVISEAILEIYRSAFNEEFPLDQVRVIKGRKNVDIQVRDTVSLKLKAGLQTSLLLDIVRNKPEFFNEEFFNYYTYDMTDITLDEDRYTYVISFRQHSYTQPPHYEGKIFIDMESLGIRAFEFHINPETINKAAKYLVIRKPRNLDVIPVSAEYFVRYRNEKDKFYLAYILSDNVFRIRKKNQLFSRTFETLTEMAVTDTKTEGVSHFRVKETTDINDLFVNQVGGYDESFWGKYNFIQPDEPLEEALKRIVELIGKEGK